MVRWEIMCALTSHENQDNVLQISIQLMNSRFFLGGGTQCILYFTNS